MGNNDSKLDSINASLGAIGKTVFVNFYYDFKDTTISNEELSTRLYKNNPSSRSSNQGFRTYRARHIFECGQELDALQLIIDSPKIDISIKEKAKDILKKEIRTSAFINEIEEEKKFIDEINKTIIYSSIDNVEYDNTPHKPAGTSSHTQTTYNRKHLVAQRALKKANYMCEIDENHPLFKRKNSDINYTEPHHIVPLSAYKDFPNVDLDREQNIVSLCSNCHNWLHYGKNIKPLLFRIYTDRKELLKMIGIDITFDQLLEYYK